MNNVFRKGSNSRPWSSGGSTRVQSSTLDSWPPTQNKNRSESAEQSAPRGFQVSGATVPSPRGSQARNEDFLCQSCDWSEQSVDYSGTWGVPPPCGPPLSRCLCSLVKGPAPHLHDRRRRQEASQVAASPRHVLLNTSPERNRFKLTAMLLCMPRSALILFHTRPFFRNWVVFLDCPRGRVLLRSAQRELLSSFLYKIFGLKLWKK